MGRMKEFCIDLINANDGIPEGITISDVIRMKELEMYNWEEYEKHQEKLRLQFRESENSGEVAKKIKVEGKFTGPKNKGEAHKNHKQ